MTAILKLASLVHPEWVILSVSPFVGSNPALRILIIFSGNNSDYICQKTRNVKMKDVQKL